MGGEVVDVAFDFASDFADDFVGDFASDFAVDSFVDSFGSEFLTDFGGDMFADFGGDFFADSFADFGGDLIGDIGGSLYEEVGSFAGDASWFDLTSAGDIFTGDLGGFADFGGDVFTEFAPFGGDFGSVSDVFADFGGDVFTEFAPFGGDVAGSWTDVFSDFSFDKVLDSASSGLSDLVDDIGGYASKTFDSIGESLSSGFDKLTASAEDYLNKSFGGIVDKVEKFVADPVSGLKDLGAWAVDKAVDTTKNIATGLIKNTVSNVAGQAIGTLFGGSQIPAALQQFTGISIPGVSNTGGYSFSVPGFSGGTINVGGSVANIGGYGFSAPGFSGVSTNNLLVPISTGYGTVPTGFSGGGFNISTSVDSALAFLTGGAAAGAIKVNNTPGAVAGTPGPRFVEYYNPQTASWDVINSATGQTVQQGLSQEQALAAAQDYSIDSNAGIISNNDPVGGFSAVYNEELQTWTVVDSTGALIAAGLTEEEALQEAADENASAAGTSASQATTTFDNALFQNELLADAAARTQGLLDQARLQQTIRNQRQNPASSLDWRVRLRLAPRSTYLYNAFDCGPVLWPLRLTDGVIFPYTPTIDLAYKANYETYDLTHSNYRGYFYKSSNVDAINVKATFTAQDTNEANYMLAVIHFFRSATKMFYGQDAERGSPPPLVYLSGLGEFQFNEHPTVISQFNYNLPGDVDYIRAHVAPINGTNLLQARQRQTVAGNPLSYSINRLASVFLSKGAEDNRLASPTLGVLNPTYVPTKLEVNITLLPIQSRAQVSQQFSLKNFANGNLLRGGFW